MLYYIHRKELVNVGSVVSAIKDTVSISLFNRGLAGKIFEDVKKSGAKVVMKNNTAECVLLPPDEYVRLMDEVNDARLLSLANERMANFDKSEIKTQDDVMNDLGITESDLEGYDEAEKA
jgi:PHD/YefM family antitoxin component YafN of YafNO toxin-antitoxin module